MRPAGPSRVAVALLVGATAASFALITLTGCAQASDARSNDPVHGSLPSFLPKSSITPDSVLIGSAARPALTVEGDAVDVHLGSGSVHATITGPVVPGEGLPYRPESTTATLMVTLEGATTTIPLSLAQFHAVDHLGNVYPMQPVPDQPALPTTVGPGQTVSFEIRAFMTTGEGILQWAPDQKSPVATWDFVVEND